MVLTMTSVGIFFFVLRRKEKNGARVRVFHLIYVE